MKTYLSSLLAAGISIISVSCLAQIINKEDSMNKAYIGTYTKKEGHVDGQAQGILYLEIDKDSGEISNQKTVANVVNPSFVKLSPDGKYLFAVSELGPGDGDTGFIYSFKTGDDGKLKQISKLPTEGLAPAHIEVDKGGEFLFVSNYLGGVVMMYRITNNGSLERLQRINLDNPEESHAHSANISPDNKMLYIADLGNDKIWIYKLDSEKGKLVKAKPAFVKLEEGAGPRHFSIAEDGEYAYSINELNSSISVFKVAQDGGLEIIQNVSSLPEDFSGKNSAADIHLHPSGKWLYVSNRGHNSIAAYKIDQQKGKLELLNFTSTKGKTPRGFILSPDGNLLYVANQDSGNISAFRINEKGLLELKSEPEKVPTPVRIELIE